MIYYGNWSSQRQRRRRFRPGAAAVAGLGLMAGGHLPTRRSSAGAAPASVLRTRQPNLSARNRDVAGCSWPESRIVSLDERRPATCLRHPHPGTRPAGPCLVPGRSRTGQLPHLPPAWRRAGVSRNQERQGLLWLYWQSPRELSSVCATQPTRLPHYDALYPRLVSGMRNSVSCMSSHRTQAQTRRPSRDR